jgi:Uma2 family endonuclease
LALKHPLPSMAESLPRRRRLTVRDYHLMGERGILPPDARVELIEGAIIDMAPIGSRHAGIVEHIADLLRSAGAEGVMVRTRQPISLDEHSEPEPDIVVVPRRADYYKSAHPGPRDVMLVVEVAESSLNYDSATKLPLYARHHIREVWIVDVERRRIKRAVEPRDAAYARVADLDLTAPIALAADPEIEVDLRGLFAA